MNKLRELVYSVKGDTREVIKQISKETGINVHTVRAFMREPYRKMYSDDALRLRNFFRQHFPCEIDDIIVLDEEFLPKRLGLVKASTEMLTKLAVQKKN